MKWLKALAFVVVAMIGAGVAVRLIFPLPSLEPRISSAAIIDTADTRLGRALSAQAQAHPTLTGIHPLAEGLEAFASRLHLAQVAERSIDAQYYIWHNDLTGGLLFNELRAAADRGVRVRLLLDGNSTSGLDAVIATLNAHPKIEVRLFNPFVFRKPRLVSYLTDFSRLNRRMHNKSFTVDNQATVVGGRNVGDEYFDARQGGALFVDLDVLAIGEVVPRVSADFDRYWASSSSYPADRIVPQLSRGHAASLIAELSRPRSALGEQTYLAAIRKRPLISELLDQQLALRWSKVRMMSDDPAKGLGRAGDDELLFGKLRETLGRPQQSLELVSGYFVPAEQGTLALSAIAGSGTKIAVLTNAFEATDVPIVHAGYARRRKDLLKAGVRIFELRGTDAAASPKRGVARSGSGGSQLRGTGSALHAKTFVVDAARVFIGSFNFDPRSLRLNTELGFVIDDPGLAASMRDRLVYHAPQRAYEVKLTSAGDLVWIERIADREITHRTEPGTSFWQRAAIGILSLLPIEWLL